MSNADYLDSEGRDVGLRRRLVRLGGVAVLLAIVALAGWHWGRPAYQRAKEKRTQQEAQSFFEKGDYRNAVMSARLTLMLNSSNVVACRIMASIADLSHSPTALDWRQRVVQIEPTVDNQLALAATALQFQNPPFPLTTEILNQLPGTATNLATYQFLAAMLALRLNHLAAAEEHMLAAQRLDPTNQSLVLNAAVLRLQSTNAAVQTAARSDVEGFCNDPVLGASALRSLVSERLLHHDPVGARMYSTQLLANASASLGDRLQFLGILKITGDSRLEPEMKSVQQLVSTNAQQVSLMAGWMQANGFQSQVPNWIKQLPAQISSQPLVQLTLADTFLSTSNWTELCRVTTKVDWGELNFMRLALLSLAFNGLGEPLMAEGQWNSAVKQASGKLGALNTLLGLAIQWGMTGAQEEILKRIMQQQPDAVWAERALEQLYLQAGDTRKLYEFYAANLARMTNNLALKNNVTATALLLRTNLTQAQQWAKEIYVQRPTDPIAVSTYAFALHVAGHDQEALAAFQKLPPAQLGNSSIALYYGLVLAKTGNHASAMHYLDLAEKGGNLLPEEKRLLESAKK